MRLTAALLVALVACAGDIPAEPRDPVPTRRAVRVPFGSDVTPGRQVGHGAVRILFAGDVMLGRQVGSVARADPSGLLRDVRRVVAGSDLAVANLESPLTLRPHIAPNPNALEARPETATLLRDAGFDAMGIANNHAGDAGRASITDTIVALRSAGLRAVGGGDGRAAYRPRVFSLDGIRVALLAFDATRAGLPAGILPGVAWWDPARARAAVREARARADVVAVGIHGGLEYGPTMDPYVLRLARKLAVWGADVVWGHHPHVVQPIRVIDPDHDGRPTVVATSLGNFLFDQALPGTRRGAILEVLLGEAGSLAYRVGVVAHPDLRVRFVGWRTPRREAVALDGEWWTPARPIRPAPPVRPSALPAFPRAAWTVVDAAVGDVTGDGLPDVAVAFRRPFHLTPEKRARTDWDWIDARGRSAHLGLYEVPGLRPIWVAGTLVHPVSEVAACDGALAVAHSTLDDPATFATGAWFWRGFGFAAAPSLPGPGTPACSDVDGDGDRDPVILERRTP